MKPIPFYLLTIFTCVLYLSSANAQDDIKHECNATSCIGVLAPVAEIELGNVIALTAVDLSPLKCALVQVNTEGGVSGEGILLKYTNPKYSDISTVAMISLIGKPEPLVVTVKADQDNYCIVDDIFETPQVEQGVEQDVESIQTFATDPLKIDGAGDLSNHKCDAYSCIAIMSKTKFQSNEGLLIRLYYADLAGLECDLISDQMVVARFDHEYINWINQIAFSSGHNKQYFTITFDPNEDLCVFSDADEFYG